jgi:probable HAF family extracellular repeat protein
MAVTIIGFNDPLAGSNSNLMGTQPSGLNDSGEVVGTYQSSDGIYHGFLYNSNDNTFTTLNDPLATGNFGTQATGINDVGQVVGVYQGAGEVLYGADSSSQCIIE